MFKKAQKEQLDIFRDVSVHLSSQAIKKLDSKTAWNTIFYDQFTSKVDDRIYEPLYFDNNGRPNASIPIMLGMMLIKEMQGWSDEQLFEQCLFNIQVKCALGLRHLDANAPGPSTYYLFRKKVAEHLEMTGEDLIEQTFAQVCSKQMKSLQISGSKIRMDSKLI